MPAVRDALDATTGEIRLLILGISSGAVIGLLLAGRVVERLTSARTIKVFVLVAAGG